MKVIEAINGLKANKLATGITMQVLIVFPLFFMVWQNPDLGKLLLDPSAPLELKQMAPDIIARLKLNLLLGLTIMVAFVIFESRKTVAKTDDNKFLDFLSPLMVGFFLYSIILFYSLQFPVCLDDAYIDFRYVYRWLNGLGFDYNQGEAILGFTSHLHLFLLFIVALIFQNQDIALVS